MKTSKLTKYCWALDLKDDEQLIQEYKDDHQAVWPEIITSLTDAGMEDLEIYAVGNRLFMIMTVRASFHLRGNQPWMRIFRKLRSGNCSCGNTKRHCLRPRKGKSGF